MFICVRELDDVVEKKVMKVGSFRYALNRMLAWADKDKLGMKIAIYYDDKSENKVLMYRAFARLSKNGKPMWDVSYKPFKEALVDANPTAYWRFQKK